MGRIVTPVSIVNALDARHAIQCRALVDTGTAGLVLPAAWRAQLGLLAVARTVELETADQRIIPGEVCGPVRIQIAGFNAIFGEITFMAMAPQDEGSYEPLVGYIVLEQSQAAVDMVEHRLVPVKHVDLKRTRCVQSVACLRVA